MSPEEVRQHADRLAPLKANFWTPWQALAWAVHRDEDRVRECSEIWRQMIPPCPVEGAPLGPFRRIWEEMHTDDEVREGWGKLLRALESGRVASSGVDAANVRREITALAWVDLEFHVTPAVDDMGFRHPEADWPQCYREGAGPRERATPAFREVLVLVADVLKEFPPEVAESASVPRKPNVNGILLKDYLKKTATPDHTQEALRILAEQAFPDNHITDARFRSALRALPTEQKRPRGGTDRTMRLLSSAK
jgi:hypothetical protein